MDVLLVRAGALGDLLLLRRTIAALRAAGHSVRLLAPPAGAVLVGPGQGEVGELLPWDGQETAGLLAGGHGSGPVGQALARADAVLAYTRSTPVLEALSCHTRRLLAHDPRPPASGPHASVWLTGPLEHLGIGGCVGGTWPDPPPLVFSAEEHSAAARLASRLPAGFLAIHPGSGSPAKNWPAERFLAFARTFARGRWLLVLGPAEQDEPWAEADEAVRARDLPLRVLAALLSAAGLFLGNDSGATHLAAAAGAPTLALFGPTDPRIWSPVGSSVRCLRAADEMRTITVEAVRDEAVAIRAGHGPTGFNPGCS